MIVRVVVIKRGLGLSIGANNRYRVGLVKLGIIGIGARLGQTVAVLLVFLGRKVALRITFRSVGPPVGEATLIANARESHSAAAVSYRVAEVAEGDVEISQDVQTLLVAHAAEAAKDHQNCNQDPCRVLGVGCIVVTVLSRSWQ